MTPKHPSRKQYPPELRERSVRLVFETFEADDGNHFGVITRIARQLGVGDQTLRCRTGVRRGRLLVASLLAPRASPRAGQLDCRSGRYVDGGGRRRDGFRCRGGPSADARGGEITTPELLGVSLERHRRHVYWDERRLMARSRPAATGQLGR